MRDATSDGTVTPLLYEERKPVLDINEEAIDNWFDKITLGLSDQQKSDLKEKYGKAGRVYGSQNRIDLIAWDIAVHFETNFKDFDLGLKGQLATDSKLSAIRYKKALDATGLRAARQKPAGLGQHKGGTRQSCRTFACGLTSPPSRPALAESQRHGWRPLGSPVSLELRPIQH